MVWCKSAADSLYSALSPVLRQMDDLHGDGLEENSIN